MERVGCMISWSEPPCRDANCVRKKWESVDTPFKVVLVPTDERLFFILLGDSSRRPRGLAAMKLSMRNSVRRTSKLQKLL